MPVSGEEHTGAGGDDPEVLVTFFVILKGSHGSISPDFLSLKGEYTALTMPISKSSFRKQIKDKKQ